MMKTETKPTHIQTSERENLQTKTTDIEGNPRTESPSEKWTGPKHTGDYETFRLRLSKTHSMELLYWPREKRATFMLMDDGHDRMECAYDSDSDIKSEESAKSWSEAKLASLLRDTIAECEALIAGICRE